jgi:hypothetical protein
LGLLLVVKKSSERVEPLLPEFAVAPQPLGCVLHRSGRERAAYDPTLLLPRDQPGVLEDAEVLHESRQGHRKRAGELGDRAAAAGEQAHHLPARGIGERGENGVEGFVLILNHTV